MSPDLGSEATNPTRVAATAVTVLLAEDEELLRQLFARALRSAGFIVLEADSSDSAMQAARETHNVDLLVSDVHLRGAGGIPLFQELLRSNPGMKAVFISGNTRESLPFALPSQVCFLEKPFDNSTLVAVVHGALQH